MREGIDFLKVHLCFWEQLLPHIALIRNFNFVEWIDLCDAKIYSMGHGVGKVAGSVEGREN